MPAQILSENTRDHYVSNLPTSVASSLSTLTARDTQQPDDGSIGEVALDASTRGNRMREGQGHAHLAFFLKAPSSVPWLASLL